VANGKPAELRPLARSLKKASLRQQPVAMAIPVSSSFRSRSKKTRRAGNFAEGFWGLPVKSFKMTEYPSFHRQDLSVPGVPSGETPDRLLCYSGLSFVYIPVQIRIDRRTPEHFTNGTPEDFPVVLVGMGQCPIDVQHYQVHDSTAIKSFFISSAARLYIFTIAF
jgi:hypothetical protein